jgi:hypothetical protein
MLSILILVLLVAAVVARSALWLRKSPGASRRFWLRGGDAGAAPSSGWFSGSGDGGGWFGGSGDGGSCGSDGGGGGGGGGDSGGSC